MQTIVSSSRKHSLKDNDWYQFTVTEHLKHLRQLKFRRNKMLRVVDTLLFYTEQIETLISLDETALFVTHEITHKKSPKDTKHFENAHSFKRGSVYLHFQQHQTYTFVK